MHQLRQWVVFKIESQPGRIKPTKIPYCANTGKQASSTDAATWCDYETARRVASCGYDGVGFVYTESDPFFFLDLDGCRDRDSGAITPDALAICSLFPGAAWEVSVSGEGLHIIGRCDSARLGRRKHRWGGWLEFYTANRFMALGSGGIHGDMGLDWTDTLTVVVPTAADGVDSSESERRPDWNGPEDDSELVRRMLASRGGPAVIMGSRPSAESLWNADGHVLGAFFPDPNRLYDASAADMALLNILAFWTGCDHERMIRLFSLSALGQREKWSSRAYYRNRSVQSAITTCGKVYAGNKSEKAESVAESEPDERFAPILSFEQMNDRLVYINQTDSVVDYVDKLGFKALSASRYYSGSTMTMESVDGKTGAVKSKTVPVFEQWLSGHKRTTEYITWKPGDSRKYVSMPDNPGMGVNMWRGIHVPEFGESMLADTESRERWSQAWVDHLAYLIPVGYERIRFEQWLAHILQHPGELPQGAYLMWTETTGIGRNWLSSVLSKVMRGYVANNLDIAQVLDGGFNGRLSKKLLAVVDEAKAGMQDGARYQRAEKLKGLINQETREVNEKYGLQTVEYNKLRWLFFSQHPDALPFDASDRRIWVIANPTDRAGAGWYEHIYAMLRQPAFVGAVWARLMTLSLRGFDPYAVAPLNDAKAESLDAMGSEIDRVLVEFRASWPGRYSTTAIVQQHVRETLGDSSGRPVNGLQYAIKRAGIRSTGGRVRINGIWQRVLVLRPGDRDFDDGSIIRDIIDSEVKFRLG